MKSVQQLMSGMDVEAFLHDVESLWNEQHKRFSAVRQAITSTLEAEKVPAEEYMVFAAAAVRHLLEEAIQKQLEPPSRPEKLQKLDDVEAHNSTERRECKAGAELDGKPRALAHVLLETIPPPLSLPSQVSTPEVQEAAAQLFESCLGSGNAQLGLKVAQRFDLQLPANGDPGIDESVLKGVIEGLLREKRNMSCAIGLLIHFKAADRLVDTELLLHDLVELGQVKLAQVWAKHHGPDLQDQLVRLCIEEDDLKEAWRLVREWDLHAVFPDVEQSYKRKTLDKMISKGLWNVAQSLVIGSPELQRQLVVAMAHAGETVLAGTCCSQFQLDPTDLPLHGEAFLRAQAERSESFCQWTLPESHIIFVSTIEELEKARSIIDNAAAIGIDAEWRPDGLGGKSPVSLLQVATAKHALIIDLLLIGHHPFLRQCFRDWLGCTSIVKLGMDLGSDLKKLAGSYPSLGSSLLAQNVIDCRSIYSLLTGKNGRARKQPVGLSKIAEKVLGKPLDKSMQMSDWEMRPLSSAQLHYAALDANVMVQIWEQALETLNPEDVRKLQESAYSIQRPGADLESGQSVEEVVPQAKDESAQSASAGGEQPCLDVTATANGISEESGSGHNLFISAQENLHDKAHASPTSPQTSYFSPWLDEHLQACGIDGGVHADYGHFSSSVSGIHAPSRFRHDRATGFMQNVGHGKTCRGPHLCRCSGSLQTARREGLTDRARGTSNATGFRAFRSDMSPFGNVL